MELFIVMIRLSFILLLIVSFSIHASGSNSINTNLTTYTNNSIDTYANSSLSRYLQWLTSDPDAAIDLFELKDILAVLHCNNYCNGTEKVRITSRGCFFSTPVCKSCYCDEECDNYGDCCPDQNGNVHMEMQTTYQCVSSKENNYYMSGYYGSYLMMTSFPDSSNLKVSSACETLPDDVAPVTSITSNVTYINKNVAVCNDDTNYYQWTMDTVCSEQYTAYSDKTKVICMPYFYPPDDLPVRSCNPIFSDPKYIDSCNVTGLWDGSTFVFNVDMQCEEWHTYPVAGGEYVFKNIYCFLCNGLTPAVWTCAEEDIPYADINSLVRIEETRAECTDGEWYDRIKNACRYIFCRQGYKLERNKCVKSGVGLPNVLYQLTTAFWTSSRNQSDPQLKDWETMVTVIVKNLPDIMHEYNVTDYEFTVYNFASFYKSSDMVPSFGLNFIFRTNQTCCRAEFEEQVSTMCHYPWILTYNGSQYVFDVSQDDFCTYGVTESKTYQVTNPDTVPEKVNAFTYTLGDTDPPEEYVSLPFIYPNCSSVPLFAGEYKRNADRSISLTYAVITIQPDKFRRLRNHQLVICVDTLEELYQHYVPPVDPVKRAKNIVSLFFSILSLICLTLTFITYCMFPSLLTLPTKNTMCLVVSLFVAQLLLQFGDHAVRDETTCKVLGVLIHYFWLSVILWMNVCSYHMFHVFVIDAAKPISIQSHWSLLLRYSLYANGTSLIIVVATIAASLGTSSGSQIGYGNDTCYLSTALLTGVCFVLPLGIVLLLNIAFFSASVWTMAKTHKKSKIVGNEKSQVHIYMKLSTLTGIFWTLSVLAETLHVQVLIFISIILNASQGVFIFISYVANRRVFDLWKGKFVTAVGSKQNTRQTQSTHL